MRSRPMTQLDQKSIQEHRKWVEPSEVEVRLWRDMEDRGTNHDSSCLKAYWPYKSRHHLGDLWQLQNRSRHPLWPRTRLAVLPSHGLLIQEVLICSAELSYSRTWDNHNPQSSNKVGGQIARTEIHHSHQSQESWILWDSACLTCLVARQDGGSTSPT